MEQYFTTEGNRPDLLEIPLNQPEGYIGYKVYPAFSVFEKGSSVSYQTVVSDESAESGRTAGDVLTRHFVSEATDTYNTTSIEGRRSVDWRDVKIMGGIERADQLGGKGARRIVQRNIEDSQADQFFTGSTTDASGAPLTAIKEGLPDIKRYAGRTALVLGYSAYLWLIQHPEVLEKLKHYGWGIPNADAVLSISQEVVTNMLQNIYGVQDILIGDDDHWETNEGHMGIVKLPDNTIDDPHLDGAIIGQTMTYLPDMDSGPVSLTSFVNKDRRCNDYDALAYVDVHEYTDNTEAKKLFTGLTGAVPTA